MSGRSSPPETAALPECTPHSTWRLPRSTRGIAIAMALICGCQTARQPEADPAEVQALAARMLANSPVPAALPACSATELRAPVTVTFRTLRLLAGQTVEQSAHETADWVNPTALDSTPARTVLDDKAEVVRKRQAASALLTAASWIVYRVDLVNAPMALGVKELKTGTITGRIIRYDRRSSRPTCVTQWGVQNSDDKTQWAISTSNKPYIDPAVMQVLRDDLVTRFIAHVRGESAPATP